METSKEKSADKRKRREGFMTHAYRLWAKCLYSMTKQLNVSARETFDGLFYPRDEFYSLLFLLPFFFPKFGSFWYSAKKIEIYIFFLFFFTFSFTFDVIWFHLLQVDERETTKKIRIPTQFWKQIIIYIQ